MKLRTKIILTTTGLVVILGILTGIVLTQFMELALNKQLEEKGQSLIKIAAEDIANPLLDGEILTVQRMLEAVLSMLMLLLFRGPASFIRFQEAFRPG